MKTRCMLMLVSALLAMLVVACAAPSDDGSEFTPAATEPSASGSDGPAPAPLASEGAMTLEDVDRLYPNRMKLVDTSMEERLAELSRPRTDEEMAARMEEFTREGLTYDYYVNGAPPVGSSNPSPEATE